MTNDRHEVKRSGRLAIIRDAAQNSPLRRVLLAYFVFNVAEWAIWIGLLVWGFDRSGVGGSSAIALVQLVPSAVLAPVAAQLLSRLRRSRALWLGYLAQAIAQGALASALLVDAPYALIAVAAAVYAVSVTLTRPAHNALVPEICTTTGELTASNAAAGVTESAATFVGPLLSGLVVAAWAPGALVLMMAVATFGAYLAVARGLEPVGENARPVDGDPAPVPGQPRMWEVLTDRVAGPLVVMVAAEYALVGMMDILLVVLALDELGLSEAGPGMLNSALGVGGLVGAALTFTLIGRQRLAPALVLGALGAGIAFALSGMLSLTIPVVLMLAVSGGGKLFFDVTCRTFVQRSLPDRMLTAVFGLTEALMMAGLALGTLAAPLMVHWLGVRAAFLISGSFLPVVAVTFGARLRRIDAASVVPPDVVALLRSVPVLALLPARVVERLAIEATAVTAPAGTAIMTVGEPGRLFYVVAAGHLDVTRGEDFLRTLGPGDWFGELALMRDVPRTATVTATDEVSLWAVEREAFLASVGATAGSLQAVRDHGDSRYR